MLFLSVLQKILTSYGSSVRCWTLTNGTPTDHTGSLGHRKNHLDEVQARSGAVTHQEIDACSNCQIVKLLIDFLLYCTVRPMMYIV